MLITLVPLLFIISCLDDNAFITKWSTLPSESSNAEIILPLIENGTYDFRVDWGDGTRDRVTEWDSELKHHVYEEEGSYTVKITGTLSGWSFGGPDSENALNLTEISQWGILGLGGTSGQFYGCRNLKITAQDIPDLSGTSSLENAFRDCWSIDSIPNMGSWNTETVTNMSGMFRNAVLFNQDISGWNTENLTHIADMFLGAASFDQDLSGWDLSNLTDMKIEGESTNGIQPVLDFWKSYDTTKTFTSQWEIKYLQDSRITLPLVSNGRYHFIVDWGDGTQNEITHYNDEAKTHSYESEGIYEVKITGIIKGWSFFESPESAENLQEITSWGSLQWGDTQWQFFRCKNLVVTAEDIPDLSATTSLDYAFFGCSSLSWFPSINNWDTSEIATAKAMFQNTSFPIEKITGWDTSGFPNMNRISPDSDRVEDYSLATYPINGANWVLGWSTDGKFCFIHKYHYDDYSIVIQDLVTDKILFYDNLRKYISSDPGSLVQEEQYLSIQLDHEIIQDILKAHDIILSEEAPIIKYNPSFQYGNSSYSFYYETEGEQIPLYGGCFAPPGFDSEDPDFEPEPIGYTTRVTQTDIFIKRTDNGSGKEFVKMILSGRGNLDVQLIVLSPYEPRAAILIERIPFTDEYDLRGWDGNIDPGFFIGKHLYAGLE